MGDEEAVRYKFVLGTACPVKEITYAAWADINFDKKTHTARGKPDVGFTVKNHESRTIPIPSQRLSSRAGRPTPAAGGSW